MAPLENFQIRNVCPRKEAAHDNSDSTKHKKTARRPKHGVGLAGRSHQVRQQRLISRLFRFRAAMPSARSSSRPAQFGTPESSHSVTDLARVALTPASPPPAVPPLSETQGFLGTDHDPSEENRCGASKPSSRRACFVRFESCIPMLLSPADTDASSVSCFPPLSHRSSSFWLSATCNACLAAGCKAGSEGGKEGRMSWIIWKHMHCISLWHSPQACMVSGLPLFFFEFGRLLVA